MKLECDDPVKRWKFFQGMLESDLWVTASDVLGPLVRVCNFVSVLVLGTLIQFCDLQFMQFQIQKIPVQFYFESIFYLSFTFQFQEKSTRQVVERYSADPKERVKARYMQPTPVQVQFSMRPAHTCMNAGWALTWALEYNPSLLYKERQSHCCYSFSSVESSDDYSQNLKLPVFPLQINKTVM